MLSTHLTKLTVGSTGNNTRNNRVYLEVFHVEVFSYTQYDSY